MSPTLLFLEPSDVDLVGRGGGGEGRFLEAVNHPGCFFDKSGVILTGF